MKHTTDSSKIYSAFKALPGSEYIASEFAIDEIIKWTRKLRPKRVLEVGSGIGTLTFALCSQARETPFDLITVEDNDFCQKAMRKNLHEQNRDYRHISSIDKLDDSEPFDLIVIDGGEQEPRFISQLSLRGVVFIEGNMAKKHTLIHEVYHKKRSYAWSNFRSPNRKKGIWIFRFEPTYFERAWFAMNNLINRAYSAVKRRGLLEAANRIGL